MTNVAPVQPDQRLAAGANDPGGRYDGPHRGEGSGRQEGSEPGFHLEFEGFSGPFELLLSLVARHRLDITTVSLATVTDDFLAYIRALPRDALEELSAFLVVAATLLDLKAARLLPRRGVEDEEDLALLEAADLLFARLLQYRAYKDVSVVLSERMTAESRWVPRCVSLEPALARLLPEVILGVTPEGLAELAGRVLTPRPAPAVATGHVYTATVSVSQQVAWLRQRLFESGRLRFAELVAEVPGLAHVVGRFLGLLELFRDGTVVFEQPEPLGELVVVLVQRLSEVSASGSAVDSSSGPVKDHQETDDWMSDGE